MYYIFLDTETDGLPKQGKQPHLVSLTWYITRSDSIVVKMEDHIIRPEGFIISREVTRIHGISHRDALQKGKPCKEILQSLVRDISSLQAVTIVGHNIEFDLKTIKAELSRHQIFFDVEHLPRICTMRTTTSYCKIPRQGGRGFKWPTLQELHFYLFGSEFRGAHRSQTDVKATILCFFELKRRSFYKLDEITCQAPSSKKAPSKFSNTSINRPPVVSEKYRIERVK